MGSYQIDSETYDKIENIFQHHPPFGNQLARYKQLRDEAKAFAHLIISASPKSREQSLALTHLEGAVFFANAAIARHEKPEPQRLPDGSFFGPDSKFVGCYGGHDPNELPGESEESGGDPVPRDDRPTGNVIPA
jgi:hypothetical protein